MQSVLSFGGTSRRAMRLEEGFLAMFDTHVALRHKDGAVSVDDAPAGQTGFVVRHVDRAGGTRFPGLCSTARYLFSDRAAHDAHRAAGKKGLSSKAAGVLIHRHVYHQVECLRAGACSCPCKTHDTPNAQAAQLLQVIKDKGWIPVRSELAVVCAAIGVATRMDLVCFDPAQDRFIHISWKTGYKDVLTQATTAGPDDDRLRAPLEHVPDNGRSWNQVQLLCEYLILTKQYQLDIAQSIIVYIRCDSEDINRVLFDSAAAWWWNRPETREAVWDELVRHGRGGRAAAVRGECDGEGWRQARRAQEHVPE